MENSSCSDLGRSTNSSCSTFYTLFFWAADKQACRWAGTQPTMVRTLRRPACMGKRTTLLTAEGVERGPVDEQPNGRNQAVAGQNSQMAYKNIQAERRIKWIEHAKNCINKQLHESTLILASFLGLECKILFAWKTAVAFNFHQLYPQNQQSSCLKNMVLS